MPFTTPCPFNESAIQLTADRSVQGFGPARRLQSTHVVACALGLLLFAPVTTFALELGEASIKSGLGQSLLVEIPYRLAVNERLTSACVGLDQAVHADALPTYTRVSRISITSTHIEIFDDRSVREPLIGLNVDVHCGTAPRFVRSYQLFVDPPAQTPTILSNDSEVAAARRQSAIDVAAPVAAPVAARQPSPRARGHAGGNLTQGQTYRVVRGDTLSGIAARIAARPATIRQTAEAIFAANPEAFTRGNRDLIEEGRAITIPIMTPATAVLPAPSVPAPLPVVRDTELATAAPVPTPNLTPAPTSAAQPLREEDAASVVAPDAIQPVRPAATIVEPSAASVPAATRADLAPESSSRATTGRTSAWLAALLALGVVILSSVPLAFVRRRKQQAAAQRGGKVHESLPRRPVDPVAGIDVVEGRPARAPSDDETASMSGADVTDSGAVVPAGLNDLALTIGPTDSVDLDVGVPVVMNERVDGFADRANASAVHQQSRHPKADLSERTMDDDQMTLTMVELEMLRQDYEAENTLTQQTSEALRDAVADLNATKAARVRMK
jgi:hypothetical protein